MPQAFAVVHARVDRPQQSFAAGICSACLDQHNHDYDQVKAAVIARIDRDFGITRSIKVSQSTGHV